MFKKLVNTILSLGLSSTLLTLPVQASENTPFVDVYDNVWYTSGVEYVYNKKIMTGLDPTHFGPSDTMNRAMLVTVLYRIENQPLTPNLLTFQDVPYGSYFIDAVRWANAKGIVTGYDANRFGPSDPVTREQIATILKRYHDYKGRQSGPSDDLSAYWDKYRVSQFADNAMRWVVGNGIISGLDSTTLGPQGDANRAQVATILKRYLEKQDSTEDPDYQAPDQNDSQDDTPSIPDSSDEPSYLYDPSDLSEIKTDSSTNTQYIDSILLILFSKSATQSQISEAIESIDGTIVGELGLLNLYQVKVPVSGLEQLEELANTLESKYKFIQTATYDELIEDTDQALTPNDPFDNDCDAEDWLDDAVNGSNWCLEAAKVPSIWGYENHMLPALVGVIDSSIHYNHSDLKVSFSDAESNLRNQLMLYDTSPGETKYWHGTAVAGVIGAVHNNDTAVAGANPKASIIFSTPYVTLETGETANYRTTERILQAIESMVKKNAHVINISLGKSGNYDELSEEKIKQDSEMFSGCIDNLISSGYEDFMIVQSAGNGRKDDGLPVDTINNGNVCCISEQYLSNACTHSYSEIMDHVVIVGSVGNNKVDGKWKLSSFSNKSSSPNLIFAPGEEVFTTLPSEMSENLADDHIINMSGSQQPISGTSFATPLVSGVISAIWSMNPLWNASTVHNIIFGSAENNASDGLNSYKMINAENAVIMAASALQIDQDLVIDPNPLYLEPGQSIELSLASNLGFSVDERLADWSIEEGASVIDLIDGKVIAKQAGEAVVKAIYRGLAAKCKIVVAENGSDSEQSGDSTPNNESDVKKAKEAYQKILDQYLRVNSIGVNNVNVSEVPYVNTSPLGASSHSNTPLYYSMEDLSGDDIPELIIALKSADWPNYTILDVFTFDGTNAIDPINREKKTGGYYKSYRLDLNYDNTLVQASTHAGNWYLKPYDLKNSQAVLRETWEYIDKNYSLEPETRFTYTKNGITKDISSQEFYTNFYNYYNEGTNIFKNPKQLNYTYLLTIK